ncbi:hypothetical protein [Halococcus saccharolyticus]|uniref:Uncharacterized protein n=1 Tax=Halococcus saccharolyticus DSM 5350 TaxID=1227455 RepID=M0MRG0_9EURY|nr:hypothetical protein [Halococcus saccharolyticus]EMA47948.1 hypothetical protein C449_00710 [Halococcus saccharolyticus DSM 5350]
MNVSNSEFFMVQLPSGESIHDTRDEALAHLRENANGLSGEAEDVSVVNVSIEGNDWQIKELAWQQIALELLGGGSE